jgi:hypothetical protein
MSTAPSHDGLEPIAFNFETPVRQHIASKGLVATDEEIEAIHLTMRQLATHDPVAGGFTFLMQTGKDGSVLDFLEQATAGLPKATKPEPKPTAADSVTRNGWTKVVMGNGTHWRRSDDPFLKILRSIEAK